MQSTNHIAVVIATVGLFTEPTLIHAAGFGISAQSGSAVGNAFAGTAEAGDASTIWYNPAGMVRLSGTNLSASAQLIRTSFKFVNNGSSGAFASAGTGEGGDGGGMAVVPQLYASRKLSDKWHVGLAVNVPFGLKTEYDAGWRGQLTALKSEARSLNINPSVAYSVSDNLALGAGVSWQSFSAKLSNFAGSTAGIAQLDADDSGFGFNLGALLMLSKSTRIGLAYRSAISYDLKGDAKFSGANGLLNSSIHAKLTVPESASIGVFSSINDKMDLMAAAIWTRWSRLTDLTVIRTSASLAGGAGSTLTSLPFDWKNSLLLAVGGNYRVTPGIMLRMGIAHDPAVSNDVKRTARLPDQSRTLLSIGGNFKVWGGTVDAAFGHELIKDAAINSTAPPAPGVLSGKFNDQADVLSIQYNIAF